MTTLTTLLDDLTFPEGPRWHDGRLWLSDFYAHEVIALDLNGRRETMARCQPPAWAGRLTAG